jgi:signal transduction histidine kinase
MMLERAEAAGARLEVISRPGHGTELIVRWQPPPEQEVP